MFFLFFVTLLGFVKFTQVNTSQIFLIVVLLWKRCFKKCNHSKTIILFFQIIVLHKSCQQFQKEFTVTVLKIDLTHFRIGAVPLYDWKNHDHKEKYRSFSAYFYIFHSFSYLNMCDQIRVHFGGWKVELFQRFVRYVPEYGI
jgi:hypothetical protein